MTRRSPTAHEFRWSFFLLQFAALGACIAAGLAVIGWGPWGAGAGMAVFWTWTYGARACFCRHHSAGLKHIRRGEYEAALKCFARSEAYFAEHPRLDRWRAVSVMSTSAASLHEMAMVAQGSCLIRLGRAAEAHRMYERVRELYPDSPWTEGALALLDAAAAGRDGQADGPPGDTPQIRMPGSV